MTASRIKPLSFWHARPDTELFVHEERQAKLGSFIANLAAMDAWIDIAAIAVQVGALIPLQLSEFYEVS
ncbi:MAG: hypothetical protein ABWU16_08735 [Halothiobacillaceae bacterium]